MATLFFLRSFFANSRPHQKIYLWNDVNLFSQLMIEIQIYTSYLETEAIYSLSLILPSISLAKPGNVHREERYTGDTYQDK